MEDIVVVTRDDNGKVTLHQGANLTAAGAVGGTFWGCWAQRSGLEAALSLGFVPT